METTVILGSYWGYIGIMEKKWKLTVILGSILGLYWDGGKDMETTVILGLYWGYIGIMEDKMEATVTLGLYWGYMGLNGKEHGNY